MSTLHERLLGSTGPLVLRSPLRPGVVNAPRSVLRAALRAVVELHAPVDAVPVECAGCDLGIFAAAAPGWPCSTIKIIAAQLGVETGETPK